ncbi:hypothetical protein [Actinomadura sediminis]|uniref:Uncharacterized protein n=1 Tax=Actinomadura sediminis TaxID=1038904 RepID=A0ABW3EUN5_9ACTN
MAVVLVVLVVVLVIGVLLGAAAASRWGRARPEVPAAGAAVVEPPPEERAADAEITAFGEELDRHPFTPAPDSGDELIAEYAGALDAYEDAKRHLADRHPRRAEWAREAVADGRAALARLDALLDGRPVPGPPCFFDARHGAATTEVPWTPEGGVARKVPVCAADAVRIAEGHAPIRTGRARRPAPAPRPAAPNTPSDATMRHRGTGDGTVSVRRPAASPVILSVESTDGIRVARATGGRAPALRSPRAVRARLPFPAEGSAKCRFKVTAAGRWTITVEPPDTAVAFVSTVRGRGPEVLDYQGRASLVVVRHWGRGPVRVVRLDPALREAEILFQGKGDCRGELALDGPCLLAVDGVGEWTVAPTR